MELIEQLAKGELIDASREKLVRLQDHVAAMPQIECPLRHFFVPGLYARECFLPKGSIVVGKIHLLDHLSVILGDVSFFSPTEGLVRVTGCETFGSPAGTKRGVYAHEDTWWTTFHPNPDNERDLAVLEARLIAPDFAQLDAELAQRTLLEATQ